MRAIILWQRKIFQALLLTLASTAACAAEITVLCANGMQTVLEELSPSFERASGHTLRLVFATGGAVAMRAAAGEAADLVIAPQAGINAVVAAGKAQKSLVRELARTGISVAVRQGSAKPDVSTPEAFKQSLLAAKSITYLDPKDGGASGIHFAKVLERLSIAEQVKAKTILAPSVGALGASVAKGQAEIGVLQYQLLFSVPGIEIVGPLPGDLQSATVFAAVVPDGVANREAAMALMSFLRTTEAISVIRSKGMESTAP